MISDYLQLQLQQAWIIRIIDRYILLHFWLSIMQFSIISMVYSCVHT